MGDLGSIFGLSILAMFNPTLLAAVTVMMLLPNTKKLMLGYLLGAYLTSISVGLLIVFSLHGSSGVESARHTLSPIEDIVVGLIALLVGYVLRTGGSERLRERRERKKAAKEAAAKQSWPERMLGRGSARVTFAMGVVLTFPGVSYLAALDQMSKLGAATLPTVLLVVAFCLIQQLLLELPLIGYTVAPEWTQTAVVRFRTWLGANGRRAGGMFALAIGALLVLRGVVELLT